jgi:hypothetical protein
VHRLPEIGAGPLKAQRTPRVRVVLPAKVVLALDAPPSSDENGQAPPSPYAAYCFAEGARSTSTLKVSRDFAFARFYFHPRRHTCGQLGRQEGPRRRSGWELVPRVRADLTLVTCHL